MIRKTRRILRPSDNEEEMEAEDRKSEGGGKEEEDDDEPVEMSAALKRRLKMVRN